MIIAQDEISEQLNNSLIGKEMRILCEDDLGNGLISGKSEYYSSVTFSGTPDMVGNFVSVRVEKYENNTLFGTVIN